MKNQYFGDINDYRKYGLLRVLLRVGGFRMLIAWMLTPDDSGADGKFTDYLNQPEKWIHYDSELYSKLREWVIIKNKREVSLIQDTDLLANAIYFSDLVPDAAPLRKEWADDLYDAAENSDFVFLDPDNGLEIMSKPYGRKNSSKYLYWTEVRELWNRGKSLLIYQHFPFIKREIFIQNKLQEIKKHTPSSLVGAFSTSHVVFLLALQAKHKHFYSLLIENVKDNWGEQIRHCGLTNV